MLSEALEGPKFLFLGYKGSGKTFLAERIRLELEDSYSDFVRSVSLGDFPFTPFSKIIRGNAEPETKYPTAWSWIILIYLLESFAKDEGLVHSDATAFNDAVNAFRRMGLSPAGNPAELVRTSAKNNFRLALPGKMAEYSWAQSEEKPASDIPDFVMSLKELINGVSTSNRHFLVIDGLDDVLTSREVQFKSLSALIFEISRLNDDFARHDVPAKIILLCRTDIFERIPGPNKNKIRQDSAGEFDWYSNPREPDSSLLVQIAELRAKRSLGVDAMLFDELLPSRIDGSETARFLLDMTRHTPRDFLRLLSHIQEFSSQGRVTTDQVKSGLRDYSIRYFLPEIRDELSGYAEPTEIDHLIKALGKVAKRDFSLDELLRTSAATRGKLSDEKLLEILEALFDCSGLGNIQNRKDGTTFYTFKFRNRNSSFNESTPIMLHRGLWKALNLV